MRQPTVVVVAHAWYEDLFGGAFRVATELAIGLAADGYHVVYICCNTGDFPDQEIISRVDVRRYRVQDSSIFSFRTWQHVQGARSLARQVAAECEIIAVSGHSPLQYLGVLLAMPAARHPRCTYVVHSPFADEQLATSGGRSTTWKLYFKSVAAAMLDSWCLRRSDVVHCLSQFTLSLLERRYGSWVSNRSIVCPGWVDTTRFRPAKDKQALRQKLPYPWQTDDPILLSVRRLESRMGLDTFIEAVARLADQLPFRVLIGGAGPEAPRLKDAIESHGLQDRVFLLGRIPEEQLAACYAASDAFVLPTRSMECFGLIVLEAFASGTPVIGSRVGAIPELLSEMGEDWMFTSADAVSLADCIRQFLKRRRPLAVDLREIANRYDQKELMPRWIDLCIGTGSPTSSLPQVR